MDVQQSQPIATDAQNNSTHQASLGNQETRQSTREGTGSTPTVKTNGIPDPTVSNETSGRDDSSDTSSDDGFQLQRKYKRKLARASKRQKRSETQANKVKPRTAAASTQCTVEAVPQTASLCTTTQRVDGPEPVRIKPANVQSTKEVYIGGVHFSVKSGDIKCYLGAIGVHCAAVSVSELSRRSDWRSFRVTVSSSDVNNVLNASHWEDCVTVRPFRPASGHPYPAQHDQAEYPKKPISS